MRWATLTAEPLGEFPDLYLDAGTGYGDVSSAQFEISPTASREDHADNPDTRVLRGVARRDLVERNVLEREQLTGAAADSQRAIALDPATPAPGPSWKKSSVGCPSLACAAARPGIAGWWRLASPHRAGMSAIWK